ncbi:ankyrin repeat family protein [Fowlpox virus]|uniref:Putative ankyrin repeat protein FPV234 n=2 Tax=Fowlpox virus TaxID=10261 RepID=V234_FOWPN|nr:Ankyrin repeat gene family protein [Fowlpox virus]P14368.2 RecName: Full=Putative ankyrin repeat protein FPV234; AltName: Full=BamHI-ORF12/ORF13 [Fowlpox virus strain NVSL]UNS14478.1 ALPV-314 [Albatrosspox virus]WPD91042.1 ankyrin repeat family protein [Avipoxvirus sp.]CAE52769.1 putative ankyrin-repeat protein [Fowlpox virus isolate HP-438/Munich]AAF44578.1 ORF FPV234 Ankyrin repeat gene family protein [Fowlpox virus]ART91667.1 ankyrin repeat family protein [Fowlpox virus]
MQVRNKDDILICEAIENYDSESLRNILENGADPNVRVPYQYSHLHNAIEKKNGSAVSLLLKHGADPNISGFFTPPLHKAIKKGCVDIARSLLEYGAIVNLEHYCLKPIHIAANRTESKIVKLLIEYGADINSEDGANGKYPIHYAMKVYDPFRLKIIKVLLDHGADINKQSVLTNTSPLYETRFITDDLLDYIISRGANINIKGRMGRNILHEIILRNGYNDFSNILVLIDHGADINALDDEGNTPFMLHTINNNAIILANYIVSLYYLSYKARISNGMEKNMKIINKCEYLSSCINIIKEEIERMKTFKIYDGNSFQDLSLFDLLSNEDNIAIVYRLSDTLLEKMNIIKTIFPNCFRIIQNILKMLTKRYEMLLEINNIMNANLVNTKWYTLPIEIRWMILTKLDDMILRNLLLQNETNNIKNCKKQ